jgi:SAM-dependent methyltransferase
MHIRDRLNHIYGKAVGSIGATRELDELRRELAVTAQEADRLAGIIHGIAPTRFAALPSEVLRLNVGTRTTAANFLLQGYVSSKRVRQVFGLQPDAPVLDWGCGSGRTLNWLAPQGSWAEQWNGCDVDKDAISWLRSQGFERATTCGDDPPLPFEAGTFGALYSFSVLTHIPPPHHTAWYEEINRVLRPGARAILTVQGDAVIAANRISDQSSLDHYSTHGWVHVPMEGHYKAASLVSAERTRRMAGAIFEIEEYHPGGYGGTMDYFIVRKR